jgi:hypothetical protein
MVLTGSPRHTCADTKTAAPIDFFLFAPPHRRCAPFPGAGVSGNDNLKLLFSFGPRGCSAPPPNPSIAWWGGYSDHLENLLGPFAICCDRVATRTVSSHCQLKSLRNERRHWAFEPQRTRERAIPRAKRGHDTGLERGPGLHVQTSVCQSTRSSLTLGIQTPGHRTEGFDPEFSAMIGRRCERACGRPPEQIG